MEKNLAILSAIFVTLYNMQIRPWTPLGDFQTPGLQPQMKISDTATDHSKWKSDCFRPEILKKQSLSSPVSWAVGN